VVFWCAIIGRLEREMQKELEATVAARRELGPDHEEHLIAGFLERIDQEIDRRVEERVARRRPHAPLNKETIGIAVPVVAVAGIFGGPAGVFVALAALALVFVVLSVSRR
jgi:hypothetical protein